jgi:SAM-dependent methyltransferase
MLTGCGGKRVLDLGCGTGAFLEKAFALGPANLDACDPCAEMVEVARKRAEALVSSSTSDGTGSTAVNIWVGDTSEIADGSYDYVVCFQVLQNLTNQGEAAAAARVGLWREIRRILAPDGGVAILTTRYRPPNGSYSDMYWYADPEIVPRSVAYMECMVPSHPETDCELAEGFKQCEVFNSLDTMIKSDAYVEGALIHKAAFRSADSFFARVERMGEMDQLLSSIAEKQSSGTLDEYVTSRDQARGTRGHVAVIRATT